MLNILDKLKGGIGATVEGVSATRKNQKTTQTKLLALSLIVLRRKMTEVLPGHIEDCCPAKVLCNVTREGEYDQRPQACSVHCKLKLESDCESYQKIMARPANPFSFVLSMGGAQAPQAPVIAGKAEAWKTPADGSNHCEGVSGQQTK